MATGVLTDTLRETLAVFEKSGVPRTTPEVADRLDLGRRSTYNRLERLVEHGRLETKKVGANARVWWRSPATPTAKTPEWPAAAESIIDDVLDGAEVGVFVLDENFDVVWINAATERYFGLDRERVLGQDKRQLVDERIMSVVNDSETFAETVLSTYDDNTYTERFECHVTSGDGREERWLEHRSKPIETGAYAGGRVELYYDVTERVRSERARREERVEFESLVNAVDEYAIFTLDTEGYVQTWNPGAECIKGYDADEIIGEHFSIFYTDDDREAGVPEQNLSRAARQGSVEDEGWRLQSDSSRFWANITITDIRDGDGNLRGYVKVTRDMTERRRAEAERELLYKTTRSIAEAETFEEGLQAALRDVCNVTDWEYAEVWIPTDEGELRHAGVDYYMDELAEFATFSEGITFAHGEGLAGRVWASREFEWAIDIQAGEHGEFFRLEEAMDAGLKSALGVPIVADNEVVCVLIFIMQEARETDERLVDQVSSVAAELGELIARRRAEERLEREREITDRIFETAPIGIAVFSADRKMLRRNEWISDLLYLSADSQTGYTAGDVTLLGEDGEPLPLEERPVIKVFETGEPAVNQEVQVKRPDGSIQWVSANVTPITDEADDIVRVVTTATDITQLKEQTHRLERRREELEAQLVEVYRRITDGVLAVDDDWRITHVNQRAEALIDRPGEELLGENLWEEFPDQVGEEAWQYFQEALDTQEPVSSELYSPVTNGWVEINAYPSETGLSIYFRDITERKERERELELYETIVEIAPDGVYALDDEDRFVLVNEALCELTGYDRSELLDEHPTLINSREVNQRANELERAITAEERDYASLEFELETAEGDNTPVESHFSPYQYEDATGRGGVVRDITERIEREQDLERQRAKLEALNSLNEVAWDITEAVIEQSTREEVEATVCERLADSDSYEFAWIAEVDPQTLTLTPHVEAGVDGYLEEVPTSMDPDEPSGRGPGGRAIRTREVQTIQNVMTDPDFEPWREHAEEYSYQSAAAIPIVHGDTLYGLLGVYADRPKAFESQEQQVIGQVGEVIGHTIAAIERKQALMSDEITEIEFTIPDVAELVGADLEIDGRVSYDRAVPTGDGAYLEYGTVDVSAIAALEAFVDHLPHALEVTIVNQEADTARFELRLSEPPVISVVASHGGYLQQEVIEDGDLYLSIHLPVSVDARRIIDAVQDAYPTADLLRRRQITRSDDTLLRVHQAVTANLTDCQRATLETAYYAGFFEWPRDATGEEVAESLGIAPATFSQHLRRGQKQVFRSLFSTATPA